MLYVALIICLTVIGTGAVISLIRCLRDEDCRPKRKAEAKPELPPVYATVEPKNLCWSDIYETVKLANAKTKA